VHPASLHQLLTELAEAGRTGALHIDGTPGGTLYLVAGHITHAESPASPGIGERLVASGRLSAETWRAAYDEGRGRHRVGPTLVRNGHLGRHELACRVVATICDTTHVLLQQEDGAPVRFVPGQRHWLGVITQIELAPLIHETAKRLRRVPAPRTGDEPPWAGRPHAARPVRPSRRPDHAALKRIRRTAKQAI
jgi:hypothetical protein